MRKQFVTLGIALIASATVLGGARAALADQVLISTGYNDEPRTGGSFSGVPYGADSGQPVPWYGSANTTFYGNASTAQASDPDEDAILLQNLGSTPLTLTAASMTGFDLFSLNSISSPITLSPGSNVILAGVDGSETGGLGTVSVTIGGVNYSYADVVTADAPGGVLHGASPFIGGCESIPWTAINHGPNTAVTPLPSSALAGVTLMGGLSIFALRRRKAGTI